MSGVTVTVGCNARVQEPAVQDGCLDRLDWSRRLPLTGLTMEATRMALKTGADKHMSAQEYERSVLEELAFGLHIRVKAIEAAGVGALAPRDLAKRMLSLVPNPVRNPMADLVGPFYDTPRVQTLLDVSKQAVSDRRKHGSVLAMRTGDGLWVYPVFQFEGRRVKPALTGVLRVFRGYDGWTASVWLTTRNDELDGRSPVEWLAHGLDQDLVLRLAAQAAHQWAA